ncbi:MULTISPECIES: hypothetical protein [Streptomyces]|jgi:hypothetical protein|uniref:hypothetical protein n=1 Tax=Streptomyces TaxID=1883 RepID=UPI000FFE602F|nr:MULTISPECIES: hypothetical protein [Streptomyces]MBY8342027.1 hypothetical protein [Streptomyces plumbidurans]
MAAEIYHTATEYVSHALTFTRGGPTQVTSVGVHYATDPDTVPAVADFTPAQLIDGVTNPTDPLAQAGVVDVVALIGPEVGADLALTAGTYTCWVLIETQAVGDLPGEQIIRKTPDTLVVL